MVRTGIILLALVCLLSSNGFTQDRDWRVTSALSFAPGFLTEKTQTIQLHGYLGFQKERIHVRGDGFYYLSAFGQRPRFDMNHQIYFGAFYHFMDNKFQPYVGFQPGIAIARSSEFSAWNAETQQDEFVVATNPVGSAIGGFTYYGEKLFFLFFEGRYIFGKHKSNSNPVFLDEMRFSFGLGFFF